MNKKYAAALAAITVLVTSAVAVAPAFAETNDQPEAPNTQTSQQPEHPMMGKGFMHGHRPGVFGTVTAVSGTTITVTDQRTKATVTINAASAKVMKAGATATVSSIAVGDTVMASGTLSGTTLTATNIIDGQPFKRGEFENKTENANGNEGNENNLANLGITGNGQPVVAGGVTAVNGNTLTITNKAGATFTVDATSAKIVKAGAAATASNVSVGDTIVVQGTVNGSSITAASVIDQGTAPQPSQTTNGPEKKAPGFFGRIGGFFSHLFGF